MLDLWSGLLIMAATKIDSDDDGEVNEEDVKGIGEKLGVSAADGEEPEEAASARESPGD